MGDRAQGLISKYYVERRDGKGVGRCIVLELEDPNTWPALEVWADTVEADGYKQLAVEVRRWIETAKAIERTHGPRQ